MDNAGVARILGEIADLLEIKGENPFKIRAYRNGADIVSNHPNALGTLDESGLREIPGIGKDLAARIVEIATTGASRYHTELLGEFPPTILELLHLQGVGPKTVAALHAQLGVATLDELEAAVMVPSFLKAGFKLVTLSSLTLPGPSSIDTTRSPLRSLTVTDAISLANAPEAVASLARCTLVMAKWSWASRLNWYFAAQSSPNVPMERPASYASSKPSSIMWS